MRIINALSKIFILTISLALVSPMAGCSRKSGCPTDDYHAKTKKDGSFKTGKTKSNLFPKDMRKKK